MSKIWRVEEEQIMKAGKIIKVNYTVWYKDENGTRTARREYRHGHYKVIPMTVLNFILDENNEATTKYQEFDGCIYKRTMYQEEKKMENINMTTAQEDIEDAIKFGWIEAQEATNTNESEEENTMKQYKVSSNRACDGQKVDNITCSMEIAQQLAESAKEAGHTNIKIEEVKEDQTMNTNTKKYSFEIRQIDALNYENIEKGDL